MEAGAEREARSISGRLVGVARGDALEVSRSAVGVATSRTDASVRQGMTAAVLAGGDVSVAQGYASVLAAAGDASVKQAGTQWLLAAGDVAVEYGGAALVAAPTVTVRRGLVGLLAARDAHLEEGAKVLFRPTGAAALGAAAGAAFAIVAAVAWAGLRRRK